MTCIEWNTREIVKITLLEDVKINKIIHRDVIHADKKEINLKVS